MRNSKFVSDNGISPLLALTEEDLLFLKSTFTNFGIKQGLDVDDNYNYFTLQDLKLETDCRGVSILLSYSKRLLEEFAIVLCSEEHNNILQIRKTSRVDYFRINSFYNAKIGLGDEPSIQDYELSNGG